VFFLLFVGKHWWSSWGINAPKVYSYSFSTNHQVAHSNSIKQLMEVLKLWKTIKQTRRNGNLDCWKMSVGNSCEGKLNTCSSAGQKSKQNINISTMKSIADIRVVALCSVCRVRGKPYLPYHHKEDTKVQIWGFWS